VCVVSGHKGRQRAQRVYQVRLPLSALGDGGAKGTVGTGAPSQAASVGHLAGTWSAHRVVWVWVVRERWSECI
jgi:hypothetical protein